MGFADDRLIINSTKKQLRSAIALVTQWCNESNIKINPEKSGILEITPKRMQHTLSIGEKFENIPVVAEYKYLGLIIDNKMSGQQHLDKLFGWKDKKGRSIRER